MVYFMILLISVSQLLLAAPIDKSFYEGDDLLRYYKKIAHEIDSPIHRKLKDPKIVELERSTLQKLIDLQKLHEADEPVPVIRFTPNHPITPESYLEAFMRLRDILMKLETMEAKKKSFQEKLFELKNRIEKAVDDKAPDNTLLSDQMQYAFYKISKEKLAKKEKLYDALFAKEFDKLLKVLPKVRFRATSKLQSALANYDKALETLEKKNKILAIDKDSEVLHPAAQKRNNTQNKETLETENRRIYQQKLQTEILLALYRLQQRNKTDFIQILTQIDTDRKQLPKTLQQPFQATITLLQKAANTLLPATDVALASTEIGLKNTLKTVDQYINKTLFVYEEKAFSIKTVLTFLFILFIGSVIAKIYKNFVDRFRRTNRIKSLSTARMLANSGYYLIILITFFVALKSVGLDLHTIFVILGAILLWLAFGLQSFISNYAVGILLRIDRSIRIGDHVELDPQTVGDIDDMNFRSVTIRASDNTRTIVPNSRFISQTFINHTLEGVNRRLQIAFSMEKDIPFQTIEKKILDALLKSNLPHLNTPDRKPQIAILDINRHIVRYALLVWVPKTFTYDMTLAQSHYKKLIHATFYPPALSSSCSD